MEALLDEHAALLTAGERLGNERTGSGGGEKPERRFVAVNPIAFWETKLWEEEKFAELCDRIWLEMGLRVILTGGAAGPLDRIRTRMKTEAVNLGGRTTLRELACLYRQAALVITTDSGPMHLAAAVGTPLVALFGPTDPAPDGSLRPRPQGHTPRIGVHALLSKAVRNKAMHEGDRRGRSFYGYEGITGRNGKE